MTERIFLSYRREDRSLAKRIQKRLGELLKSGSANVVVIDGLKAATIGEDVRESIKTAIGSSNTVVFVTSANSAKSPWMNYEAGLADALGKKIVVVGKEGMGKSTLLRHLPKDAEWIQIEAEG